MFLFEREQLWVGLWNGGSNKKIDFIFLYFLYFNYLQQR
jgi:hypothetical protein